MKTAYLGDLEISRICVGCWSFGGGEGSYWGPQAQEDVDALVREALDLGVNFFDTAFGYNAGESERALGHALCGIRQRAVICDKTPIMTREQLEHAEDFIKAGLDRLETDYLDLLMIHWPTKDRELLIENLQALDGLRKKGMVKHLGVSNFGVETLNIARDLGIPLVADELAYNLITRAIEYEILPLCRERGIGVTAYMPLMQGLLTGKYRTPADIPDMRRRSVHFNAANNPQARHGGPGFETETMAVVAGLCALAEKCGTDAGTLAIAWLLHQPGVACAMVGCRNAAQVRQNAASAGYALSPDVLAELDALTADLKAKLPRCPDLFLTGEKARVW
ncbi:MAG: aldo/keto reductase [Clostridiales bacterium]|jgi:myo-inositol catabolism protein IolS|nr:aldo/keto reductase [Clostridiales bacterium]